MKDGIIRFVNGLSDQISASLRLCGKKNNSKSGKRECLVVSKMFRVFVSRSSKIVKKRIPLDLLTVKPIF